MTAQVVDELFSYWTLEDSEDTLEQLEDLLIVRAVPLPRRKHSICVYIMVAALSWNVCSATEVVSASWWPRQLILGQKLH